MGFLKKLLGDLRRHLVTFFIALFVTLLGVSFYSYAYIFLPEPNTPLTKFVDDFELKSFDLRFSLRGNTEPSPDIVIVGIDEATLSRVGSYPFSRKHWVRMLDQLTADGAKVIGFDINFMKPDDKSAVAAISQIQNDYARQVARGAPQSFLQQLAERAKEADTDQQLAEAIERSGNVVLGYHFDSEQDEFVSVDQTAQEDIDGLLTFSSYTTLGAKDSAGAEPPPLPEIFLGEEGYLASPPLALFTEAAGFNIGYFNIFSDADSILRRTPVAMKYAAKWRGEKAPEEVNFYPSLDLQILRRFLDVPEHEMVLVYNKAGVEKVTLGDRKIPVDAYGQAIIHYQGGPHTYPHFSLSDVLEGTFPAGTFRDKIVLVGPTALIINDFFPSPMAESTHTGVEIHANFLDTVLNQRFISRGIREQLLDLLVIIFFGMGFGFFLARVPPSWTVPLTLAVLVVFVLFEYLTLTQWQMWLNMVAPGSVLVINAGAIGAYRMLIEEREKRKTRSAFAQYVPPGLVSEMLKNPEGLKLGGEERELSIMFSDIRGFTSLSERLSPMELTTFLNDYTDEMTDIIFRHWGTLDKYEGDAIMAFWGAPYRQDDHTMRCCAASLDQGRRMDELRLKWKAEGKPDINIGIGVNTGQVVVGNMGSRKRFNYTVLGDPVNLAARLEGVNKTYATRIIVSEFTHRQAAGAFDILSSRISRAFKVTEEELHSVNGLETEPASKSNSELVARARQYALYVGHQQKLAAPRALAQRYGFEDETQVPELIDQVEQWKARNKKLTHALFEVSRGLHHFLFRQLDWIRVKGKEEPVGIYELLDYGENEADWTGMLGLFGGGLQAYRNRQWDFAIDLFQTILDSHPDDGPSRIFLERCRQYMVDEPSEEWDGVYVMTTK